MYNRKSVFVHQYEAVSLTAYFVKSLLLLEVFVQHNASVADFTKEAVRLTALYWCTNTHFLLIAVFVHHNTSVVVSIFAQQYRRRRRRALLCFLCLVL